jgi:cytidylate kinase
MRKLIIAIDGPVGSGKSTVARLVAQFLDYVYVDTGAMYRAFALKALRSRVPLDAEEELVALARETRVDLLPRDGSLCILLDGEDVSEAIRSREVSEGSSKVSVFAGVRQVMVAEQRRAGSGGGVVMEGRDIGSVVFPDADLKIYLTASADARAERRWREHQQKGDTITLERTREEVRERDRRDREREVSPLVRAPDAVLVDSSAMDAEEVARLIVLLAESRQDSRSSASGSS